MLFSLILFTNILLSFESFSCPCPSALKDCAPSPVEICGMYALAFDKRCKNAQVYNKRILLLSTQINMQPQWANAIFFIFLDVTGEESYSLSYDSWCAIKSNEDKYLPGNPLRLNPLGLQTMPRPNGRITTYNSTIHLFDIRNLLVV